MEPLVPQELFAKYNDDQLFAALVDVFHRQVESQPHATSLRWDRLVESFRPLVEVAWTQELVRHYEALQVHAAQVVNFPDHQKLSGAAWRFVAMNYAYPQLSGSSEHRLNTLILTELGRQVCSKKPEDNPARPGYIERLRKTNPQIEEEVFERLLDASACLDAGLHRPAIVMLGIAAEVTTIHAYRALKTLALISKNKEVEFKEQLSAIAGALENLLSLTPEQRHRVKLAFVAVESIRVLRNSAAHHGNPAPDPYAAHDQLGAACFHLPVIWTELILPNKP